jgi:uroporphyrinogen decarboxylase
MTSLAYSELAPPTAARVSDDPAPEAPWPHSAPSSLERVLTTLSQREPDRVPLFLLLTTHGARALGLSIREYFAQPENVVEGQLRMLAEYGHDCIYSFQFAAREIEAWGGETIYADDGPPNAGAPPLQSLNKLATVEAPAVADSPSLQVVLESIRQLAARAEGRVPLVGVVLSPFSLPVLQMGMDRYIELLHESPRRLSRLFDANVEFCVEWANAQLVAGVTAICYFDPFASPTILSPRLYRQFGHPLAVRAIRAINGPTAMHLASGRSLPVVDDLASTGALILGVSGEESLAELKRASARRLTIVGNLNALEMRRWSDAEIESAVRAAIRSGGPGGGFILADNHGEIPFQVPESTLRAVAAAVRKWGRYPLDPSV